MVSKLQDDVNRYESLAKLEGSEVEAIAQTLRGELRSEGSRSLLKSASISLMFFIAGVVVTSYAAYKFKNYGQRRTRLWKLTALGNFDPFALT